MWAVLPGPAAMRREVNKAAAVSSLYTNLMSYWSLEEASGTRVDAVTATGNDLTDNNTVTQNPGKVGNAAQFTAANTEYLSHVNTASLQAGDIDWAWAFWVYLDSKTDIRILINKNDGSGYEYQIYYDNSADRLKAFTNGVGVTATTFGAPSTATWYFIVQRYDSVNNLLGISINDGAFDTAALASGGAVTTGTFTIGFDPSSGLKHDGRIDEVAWWKNFLPSSAQRTWMYNSGNGRAFSEFPGAP